MKTHPCSREVCNLISARLVETVDAAGPIAVDSSVPEFWSCLRQAANDIIAQQGVSSTDLTVSLVHPQQAAGVSVSFHHDTNTARALSAVRPSVQHAGRKRFVIQPAGVPSGRAPARKSCHQPGTIPRQCRDPLAADPS